MSEYKPVCHMTITSVRSAAAAAACRPQRRRWCILDNERERAERRMDRYGDHRGCLIMLRV